MCMLSRALSTGLLAVLLAVCWSFAPPARGQTVDPTFNPDLGGGRVDRIARGPDGNYYLIGEFDLDGRWQYIVRVSAAGTRDTTFNVPANAAVKTVAFSNGQILIGGAFDRIGSSVRPGIARLNADGSLDPSFVPPALDLNTVRELRVAANGIYASGSFRPQDLSTWRGMARFTTNGALDPGFQLDPATGKDYPDDFYLRADGTIAWFGTYRPELNDPWSDPISVFSANGDILATHPFDDITQVTPRGNGGWTAIGSFPQSPGAYVMTLIAKVTPFFERDWNFVPVDFRDAHFRAAAELADGRVMVLGKYHWVDESTVQSRLGRLLPSGQRDLTWNEVTFTIDTVRAMLVEADGTVLVGGWFTHVNGVPHPTLARIIPDVRQDPIFGNGFD